MQYMFRFSAVAVLQFVLNKPCKRFSKVNILFSMYVVVFAKVTMCDSHDLLVVSLLFGSLKLTFR